MNAPVRQFVRETGASPEAVARVTARLLDGELDAAGSQALLAQLPSPAPGAELRIRARLAHPPRRLPVAVPALLAAAAATALVGVATLGAAALLARQGAPDAPLSGPLASPTWRDIEPTAHVDIQFQGTGTVGGSRRAPVIAWEAGILRVEVEPDRGVDLTVSTAEAEVRVLGTGFAVTRDALGTLVAVSHGRVAVVCRDGTDAVLQRGETHLCLPTRPGGLLGRARRLEERDAPPEQVLDTAERGLAAGAEGPIRGELTLLRLQALTTLARHDEALAAAEQWLAGGETSRRGEIRHLAAQNAMPAGGCAAALPHLEALRAEGATAPELILFADCVSADRPAEALDALTDALRLGVPSDQESAIIHRITDLPSPGRP